MYFDTIPSDPVMLLSFVNTKLRDEYKSLAELCSALDAREADIKSRLGTIGYTYDASLNKFV